ncbi:YdcF family protein [Roseateles koreensis]|uniref:YdcF family protein n=1 Tax=Roseateles koreensis TaxID=2987526 RepID=A0ABT5KX13_9BURK|nr:YdcF family protein [Roseateles koreensis]MDC8786935.1 YdcF family protein [Roseateles koreensis]
MKTQAKGERKVAVLVLGGGARNLSPEYHAPALKPITEERLRYGAWVAKTIQAPLGFSGGIGWGAAHLRIAEAVVAHESAQNTYGVPLRWSESRSRDTRENAELTLPMLQADGVQTVILVTHDLHMRRAMRAFSKAATGQFTFIAAPVGLRRETEFSWQDWCPSEEGLPRVRYAVYEWLGLLAGH